MAVSTIYQTQRPKKTYTFLYVLLIVALLAAIYFGVGFVTNYFQLNGKSKLTATVFYGEGGVYVNDELMGPFPYESKEIKSGENKITMKGNGVEYQVTLDFLPNTEAILKRDLGVSQNFSAGQNFWFEKNDTGTVLSVLSEPNEVDVYIDGTKVGTTPYTSSDLTPGAYDLKLQRQGFEPQTARIEVIEDLKLNVSVTLFEIPVSEKVALLQDSTRLYDVFSDSLTVTSNTQDWVDAIIYWNRTRGINLAGVGTNKELVFDFYLDSDGNVYSKAGNLLSLESADIVATGERGAYLRKVEDGPGLSEKAKESYLTLTENADVEDDAATGSTAKQATVLETGLGWLRVRSEPGLNGTEVTKVNVGDSFDVLEEGSGWVKIRIDAETEGWVSDTYVSIE